MNFQPVSSASAAVCKAGPQVPVISIDIEQDPCQTAFMGADNHYAGVVTGTALGNYFKKNFNCEFDAFISLEDYGVGLVNEARMSGYRDGFQSVCGAGSIGDKLIKIDAGRLEPALAKMKVSKAHSLRLRLLVAMAIFTLVHKVQQLLLTAISRTTHTGLVQLHTSQSVMVKSEFLTLLT